jgi:membrane protein implicated in regulation of membrane protease activity
MKRNQFLKTVIFIIIGIILYFIFDLIFGEVVSADDTKKGNDDLFPFYWLMVIVGGSIASTLSYVSWRKYKGEKKEKQGKLNDK